MEGVVSDLVQVNALSLWFFLICSEQLHKYFISNFDNILGILTPGENDQKLSC